MGEKRQKQRDEVKNRKEEERTPEEKEERGFKGERRYIKIQIPIINKEEELSSSSF